MNIETGEKLESYCDPELESQLTNEEIEFIRQEASGDSYVKAVAMSRIIRDRCPELGSNELHTSTILARELEKDLGQGNVGILVGEIGQHESKWIDWRELTDVRDGKNIEARGVCGVLEGDNPNGPIIMIRGDMDALPTEDGKAKHMCGHNVHTSWLKLNCATLCHYKEHFGQLPFKRVLFVGEVNEEGITSSVSGPNEMFNADLFKKVGKPDILIAAHLAACQPEGTILIEKGLFLAAEGTFGITLTPSESYQGPDPEIIKSVIEFRLAQEFDSETPKSTFGTLKPVANISQELPEQLVRATDSKSASEKRQPRSSLLKSEFRARLFIDGKFDDLALLDKEIEKIRKEWSKLGIHVSCTADLIDDGGLEFTIGTRPGHVAFGGPNAEYFGARVINAFYKRYGLAVKSDKPQEPKEIVGSIRLRGDDWREKNDEIFSKIMQIVDQTMAEMKAQNLHKQVHVSIETPPVINDYGLCATARNLAQRAGIELTTAGLPHLAAESFARWQRLTHSPAIYLGIGGADRAKFAELLKSGQPVPDEMMHHNPKFSYQERAIGYGALMAALTIEFGRKWKK